MNKYLFYSIDYYFAKTICYHYFAKTIPGLAIGSSVKLALTLFFFLSTFLLIVANLSNIFPTSVPESAIYKRIPDIQLETGI